MSATNMKFFYTKLDLTLKCHQYTLEHQNGQFIILTNEDAHNNRVMITDAVSNISACDM